MTEKDDSNRIKKRSRKIPQLKYLEKINRLAKAEKKRMRERWVKEDG